ncbi:MAG: helix-turn-helix domain-containing protein, partial [Muribaculaceae bacterium]|nr:helix-turn-helix domain-containing protein [Muribaculaceae bacterium]
KKIVLKVLRYMEDNHMSQKELADKLDVSPQYINKFLHGQECDIKVSTAIRYGKLLNLKLIDIPDSDVQEDTAVVNEIYLFKNCILKPYIQKPYSYDCISNRVINQLYSYN